MTNLSLFLVFMLASIWWLIPLENQNDNIDPARNE